jgi:hypothetical protein
MNKPRILPNMLPKRQDKPTTEEMLAVLDDLYLSSSLDPWGERAGAMGAIRAIIERAPAVEKLVEAARKMLGVGLLGSEQINAAFDLAEALDEYDKEKP